MSDSSTQVAGDEAAHQLITLAEAAELSGLSHSHLRLLVRRGMIWGKKFGRDWLTTEAAVKEYLAMERRPGPRTEDQEISE
jgi:excisionase family DNA binding protein